MLSAEPKVEANSTSRNFEENKDKHSIAWNQLDIVLENNGNNELLFSQPVKRQIVSTK